MDASRFDALTRALVTAGSRRGLLGLVAALPLGGGLTALLAPADDATAKGRRKRRKKRHKHGKGRRHKHHKKQKCKAKSLAKTCAGKCGKVRNNCKKTVDCGSCACVPPCEICQTCQGEPGACVQDPAGTPCGETGQVCLDGGACACDETSCPACTTCGQDGFCTGCDGCCDGETCVADCGACQTCDGQGQCASCTSLGQICCGDTCVAGICCDAVECPAAGAPDCVAHACVCAANDDEPCPGSAVCCDDGCADLETDPEHCGDCATACSDGQVCQGGICGSACGSDFCSGDTPVCFEGACVCGDVCNDDCQFATVQSAINAANSGDTVRICAGAYTRDGDNSVAAISGKNLTLIGAGAGSGGTILDGGGVFTGLPVLFCTGTTTDVRQMTVTGANGNPGVVNDGTATLTLADVTVTGNTTDRGGGIINSGALTLNAGTSITGNSVGTEGGGIYNEGTLTLNDGSSVIGNFAPDGSGIFNSGGTVTLNPGSLVCGNAGPQCSGFTPPSGFCQDICP